MAARTAAAAIAASPIRRIAPPPTGPTGDSEPGAGRIGRGGQASQSQRQAGSNSLSPAVALLGVGQRGSRRHPLGAQHGEAGIFRRGADGGVVVDQYSYGPLGRKPAQQAELGSASRPAVARAPHDQAARRQSVPVQPRDGVGLAALRPPGEVDDVVVGGQPLSDRQALGERRIVGSGGEEGVPVLGAPLDKVEAMARIGDHAVDVDGRESPFGGFAALAAFIGFIGFIGFVNGHESDYPGARLLATGIWVIFGNLFSMNRGTWRAVSVTTHRNTDRRATTMTFHGPLRGRTAMDLTTCPECKAPAEVQRRVVIGGTSGPLEHVKLMCVRRHWFFMPVFLLESALEQRAA